MHRNHSFTDNSNLSYSDLDYNQNMENEMRDHKNSAFDKSQSNVSSMIANSMDQRMSRKSSRYMDSKDRPCRSPIAIDRNQ